MRPVAFLLLAFVGACGHRSASDTAPVHVVNATKFVGSQAYCAVHGDQMALRPERRGTGTNELPQKFMGRYLKDFPNDGYFYPLCSIETAEKVWVCGKCQKESSRAKARFKIEP